MSEQTTMVVSRVIKGRDWSMHQQAAAADLEAQLRHRAEQQDLILDTISDVAVEPGELGGWARLTRTATAHPRQG